MLRTALSLWFCATTWMCLAGEPVSAQSQLAPSQSGTRPTGVESPKTSEGRAPAAAPPVAEPSVAEPSVAEPSVAEPQAKSNDLDAEKGAPGSGSENAGQLKSARAAITTFVVAMETRDLQTAVQTLDFSQITPAPSAAEEFGYATMLKRCIDRIALVDAKMISDAAEGPEQAFPPDQKDTVIRIARCEDGMWRFTPETIAGITALYEVLKDRPIIGEQVPSKAPSKSTVVPKGSTDGDSGDKAKSEEEGESNDNVSVVVETEVPDHLRSARQVMMTLFRALDENTPEGGTEAVSTLDFSEVLKHDPEFGPYAMLEMTRKLRSIIERMQDFSFGRLSDDPNGSAVLFPFDKDNQPIVISRGERGVWSFSADTVEKIPALHEIYRSREVLFLTGSERPWYRRELVMGNEVWQILTLFGAVFSCLLIGRVIRFAANSRARVLKEQDRVMSSLTFETIAKTVPFLLLVLGLAIGIQKLTLGFEVGELTDTILRIIVTLVIGYICFRLVDVLSGFLRELARRSGSTLNDMLVPIVSTSMRVTIIVMAVLEIATAISNKPPSAVIAGLGAGGLAIGLAAQDTIKNFFGSVLIFADRPFELGDRIVIDGHDGPVEAVGFRSTRIRTLEGHLVTVPNAEMAARTVQNIGKRKYIRRTMDIRIAYGTAPDKVEQALQILRDVLDHHEGFNEENPPRVFLHEFLESAVSIRAIYWYYPPAYWDYCAYGERLNLQIIQRFAEAGITFALPAQQLFVAGDTTPES